MENKDNTPATELDALIDYYKKQELENTETIEVELHYGRWYHPETGKFTWQERTIQVAIPEGLTERQIKRIKSTISQLAYYHFSHAGDRDAEFKTIKVTKYNTSSRVYLSVESGYCDDEGTTASIFFRNNHYYMIGTRGGLDALNKKSTWIDGRSALLTQCN